MNRVEILENIKRLKFIILCGYYQKGYLDNCEAQIKFYENLLLNIGA